MKTIPSFETIAKRSRHWTCAYLYAATETSPNLLAVWENVPVRVRGQDAPKVEAWTLYRLPEGFCRFAGRLVIHDRGFLRAMAGARAVESRAAGIINGSDNTRSRNISIGNVTIEYHGGDCLYLHTFPELLSTGLTYQPEAQPFHADVYTCLTRVGFEEPAPFLALAAAGG